MQTDRHLGCIRGPSLFDDFDIIEYREALDTLVDSRGEFHKPTGW